MGDQKKERERDMLCLAKQHSISVFLSFSRSLTLSQDARTVFVVAFVVAGVVFGVVVGVFLRQGTLDGT